jgi:hypothetical protein
MIATLNIDFTALNNNFRICVIFLQQTNLNLGIENAYEGRRINFSPLPLDIDISGH